MKTCPGRGDKFMDMKPLCIVCRHDPAKIAAHMESSKEQVADISKAVSKSELTIPSEVTSELSLVAGRPCPTCGKYYGHSPADRQKRYRERRKVKDG